MGSNPSFNPSVFTGPITQKAYDQKFGANSGDPLLNRAIQSVGPTGSNYKPITAVAALREQQVGHQPGVRRHRQVLRGLRGLTAVPAELRRRRVRRRQPGPGDQGLRRQLLLQPRRPDQRQPDAVPQRRSAAEWSREVRDRAQPRDRPARRAERHASGPALARRAQQARGRVRHRDGRLPVHEREQAQREEAARVSPQPQARRGRLRDRRRHRPAVDRGRQREPRGRPGRRPGVAAATRARLLGDRQRRHGRHPAHRHEHRERRRHRAAEGRSRAAEAQPAYQPAVPGHGSPGPARGRPDPRRHVRRRDGRLPRAGLRQDRHRPVLQRRGRARPTTPGTRASCRRPRRASRSRSRSGSRRAGSAISPRRRSPGRSCRSGSSASPGRSRRGSRPTQ